MGISFLMAKINYHPCIRDRLICWDEEDFVVSHHKNRVRSFLSCFIVALRHTAKILAKGSLPNFPLWQGCASIFYNLLLFHLLLGESLAWANAPSLHLSHSPLAADYLECRLEVSYSIPCR
jgi:hypothetical protein